jgi:hypothetical protein
MSKLLKGLGVAVLLAATIAATSVPAQARWHGGGGWHGGGWHGGGYRGGYYGGGGWGWGPGFGLGLGLGTVWGYPYYYGGPYYTRSYYGGSACGWSRTRVWRYNHWAIRRVWRCW